VGGGPIVTRPGRRGVDCVKAAEWSGMGPRGASDPWGRYPAERALTWAAPGRRPPSRLVRPPRLSTCSAASIEVDRLL
jgi:hypothetical protein